MGIFETFSKRKRRIAIAGQQDIFQYDNLPQPFRAQVIHIWSTPICAYYQPSGYSSRGPSPANQLWEFIFSTHCREHGVFSLGNALDDPSTQCKQFIMSAGTNDTLDMIELHFRVIDRVARKLPPYEVEPAQITQTADDAIEELNHRFREHGIGYQFMEGELVRVDSQFIHAEAVKPALSLLNQEGFEGPAGEFMRAFDHYRHGRHKEAVAEALKSFESTMKAVCKARKWHHPQNATAKPLMDVLFKNELIPSELESHFAGLRAAMESGIAEL